MNEPLEQPESTDPCLCGSGEAFQACCGPEAGNGPRQIAIIPGFLEADTCRRIVAYAHEAPAEPMGQATTGGYTVSDQRVGSRVDIAGIEEGVNAVVEEAFRRRGGRLLRKPIAWFERPAILAYGPGGRYIPHADADAWNREARRWERVVDRDVSLLIYLDDDYEGGELYFPRFDFRLRPRTGMLVLFPSDARYAHCAEPVIRGERHVIVSWAAAAGADRVLSAPPEGVIRLI